MKDPKWWSEEHSSAWDRVKAALKRDWEQTKNDLSSSKGRDLDQDVPDTVKQAVGSKPIPPANVPNPPERRERPEWKEAEAGARFGVGARKQYKEHTEWDERLESRLRDEWNQLGTSQKWEQARAGVQSGWERGKPGDFRS